MYNPTSIVCNRGQKYFTRKVISYKGKITPVTIHYFTRKTSILNVLIVCLVHHLMDGDPVSRLNKERKVFQVKKGKHLCINKY